MRKALTSQLLHFIGCFFKDRIGELFGAVGNLHISLFEILFKNPFTLLNQHILEELEGDGPEGTIIIYDKIAK